VSDCNENQFAGCFFNTSQYFRQCFNVTATKCEETAASTTRIFLTQLDSQISELLHQPKDGTYCGSKVCAGAGSAYECALIKK
jgi:hypothetical protein